MAVRRIDQSLTLRTITPADYGYLYSVLAQRTPDVYISSGVQLPSWQDHVSHWDSTPYAESYIVMLDDQPAGYCYLSRQNEIGLHLLIRGRGIGPAVIRHLCRSHPGVRLYANVSPVNTRAQQVFERLGWRELQRTYAFTQPNGDLHSTTWTTGSAGLSGGLTVVS